MGFCFVTPSVLVCGYQIVDRCTAFVDPADGDSMACFSLMLLGTYQTTWAVTAVLADS
jgi:hypothetical protein